MAEKLRTSEKETCSECNCTSEPCVDTKIVLEELAAGLELENLEEIGCTCCHGKTKKRDEKEFKDLYHRLNRIEGQVRGVKRMLEEDCYCVDILTQVTAIASALKGFECELLSNHIKTCVSQNLKAGNDEVADELVSVVRRLMK